MRLVVVHVLLVLAVGCGRGVNEQGLFPGRAPTPAPGPGDGAVDLGGAELAGAVGDAAPADTAPAVPDATIGPYRTCGSITGEKPSQGVVCGQGQPNYFAHTDEGIVCFDCGTRAKEDDTPCLTEQGNLRWSSVCPSLLVLCSPSCAGPCHFGPVNPNWCQAP